MIACDKTISKVCWDEKMYGSRDMLAVDEDEYVNEIPADEEERTKEQIKKKLSVVFCIICCVLFLCLLTVFLPLILNNNTKNLIECSDMTKQQNPEARELYHMIKQKYEELHPYSAFVKNSDGNLVIHPSYFNFTPELYKKRSEEANKLLQNLEKLSANLELTKEESLTMEIFRQFLKSTFGHVMPYESNYEIGDWMLGPNIFCWQISCYMLPSLESELHKFHPQTVKDVELMENLMKKCAEGYQQKIRNLKNGIKAGIVLPKQACDAGLQNFKHFHVHVAKHGKIGILKEVKTFEGSILLKMQLNEKEKWWKKYKISVMSHLKSVLVENVGKSLHDYIRFLEDNYSEHCPPSELVSGLASLPLPYVYNNGVANHSDVTTGYLPGGKKFNGKNAYLALLSHFTTYNITTYEVNQMADDKLKSLFPKVKIIAKSLMSEKNVSKAIEKFRVHLQTKQFFYDNGNKTRKLEQTYLECYDDASAQKHCPRRFKAMNIWLRSAKQKLKRLKDKIHLAFYVKGRKTVMPSCKATMAFAYTPANAFYSYGEGNVKCSSLAKIYIPFFLERPGPKYEELSVMAHETYPGHHLEVQGVKENMPIKCDKLRRWASRNTYFAAFSEGWATYVENSVVDRDMKMYMNDMERYGMIKHQILSALRAKVDVGLHYFGMKRQEAVTLYEKYALDKGDIIQKEITRLQSSPGQGTAYMVGEDAFEQCRHKAKVKLGKKFDIREFHYQILRHGELPLTEVRKKIDEYIKTEEGK